MRKFALIIVSVIVVFQCYASFVSKQEACKIANSIGIEQSVDFTLHQPAKDLVAAYYIIEDKSGQGWAIIAADDIAHPVLAYSAEGQFTTANMPTQIQDWLDGYERQINKAREAGIKASADVEQEWSDLRKGIRRKPMNTKSVEPLIQTRWGQEYDIYNLLCPIDLTDGKRAVTGCVATTMAQIMKYYEWPKQGTGSLTYQPNDASNIVDGKYAPSTHFGEQSADFGATSYDWANMLNSYVTLTQKNDAWYYSIDSSTDAQKKAVAELIYHCGVSVQMMYSTSSSSAFSLNYGGYYKNSAEYALQTYFGYKTSMRGYQRDYAGKTTEQWIEMIKNELDNARPIMYSGSGSAGGHNFICDGYDANGLFHFNWGWCGMNDGYYSLDALTPGSGGAGGGDYNFTTSQEMLINIQPNRNGEDDEQEEAEQTEYIAKVGTMTYYAIADYSDLDNYTYNNISLYLYDDTTYSAMFYFNMVLPEYNRIGFGDIPTENQYTCAELMCNDGSFYYIAGDDDSTYKYYSLKNGNCASSTLNITYKGVNAKGDLLYDIVGTVTNTKGTTYTVCSTDLVITGTSAVYDNTQPDGYRYTEMSLTDDDTYRITVVNKPYLLNNHSEEIGVDYVLQGQQFKLKALLRNTGTQTFEGRLSGYIYKLDGGVWNYYSRSGYTGNISFTNGKSTYMTYSFSNTESYAVGEYKFVPVYGKDLDHWFASEGDDAVYYFSITNEDIATDINQTAVIDGINEIDKVEVFSVLGQRVANDFNSLSRGTYIVLTNGKAKKIIIK